MAVDITDEEIERRVRCLDKSHLQECARFIVKAARLLNWGDLSNSVVMDVGCGIEFYDVFVYLFPRHKHIIGIDNDEEHLFYLQGYRALSRGNSSYYLADITDWDTVSRWEGQFLKMTSFYCLNCIDDKRTALQNIYRLLKPGGEVIVVSGLINPAYECVEYMTRQEPWREYRTFLSRFPEHENNNMGPDWYVNLLTDVGFEILYCEEYPRRLPFESRAAFNMARETEDGFFMQFIPPNLKDQFKAEYRETLRFLNRRNNRKELYVYTTSLHLVIKKPTEASKPLKKDVSKAATGYSPPKHLTEAFHNLNVK